MKEGSGLGVRGLAFRVEGLGFRVQGLGFRVTYQRTQDNHLVVVGFLAQRHLF